MMSEHVKSIVNRMSLKEKIGQCVIVGMSGTMLTSDIREAVVTYHCGGIRLSPFSRIFRYYTDDKVRIEENPGQNSKDKHRVLAPAPWITPDDFRGQLEKLKTLSTQSGAGIPVHFVIDQEGDTSRDLSRGGFAQFPSCLGMAAADSPDITYRAAKAVAKQAKATGIDVIHSPVLDVNINPENPEIGRRSFGDDPETVAIYGEAVIRGFHEEGILAVAKHFPGRGDSAVDAHFQCPVLDVSRNRLDKIDLYPYRSLMEKGLRGIMTAHCVYPALDDCIATVSRKIVTGLLREEMGFSGLITTDSITMGALIERYGVAEASVLALIAGADFVLMKAENRWRSWVFEALYRAVEKGRLDSKELDEKVGRILAWKEEAGLLSKTAPPAEPPSRVYGTPEIRRIEREAAEHAVLVPKGAELLPVDRSRKTVFVYQENSIKSPNDQWDYPSMLGDIMEEEWPELVTVEIPFGGEDATGQALSAVKGYNAEKVIVTGYYDRSMPPCGAASELLKLKIPVILITNTPYTINGKGGLLAGADTVIINMNLTPEGHRVTRDILTGRLKPKGQWPLKKYNPFLREGAR